MSFPLASAAQVGVIRTAVKVPVFTNFEIDADTAKTSDPTNLEPHKDANGATSTLGVSDPTLRITGSMMVTATRQVTVTPDSTANTFTTASAHGLLADDIVRFTTAGTLPAGLLANTDYFVLASGLTSTAYKVALTSGGSAIDISDTGTGTIKGIIPFKPLPVKGSVILCKDASAASPWYGKYLVFMKADVTGLVAGKPAIFDFELGLYPAMQAALLLNGADIDA